MRMRIFTFIALLCSVSLLSAQDFTIKTSSTTGEGFSFQMNAFNKSVKSLSIDWGNGVAITQTEMPDAKGKTYTAPAGVSGSKTIKIYSDGVEGILLTGGDSNPISVDNFTIGATNYLTTVQLNECDLKAADLSQGTLLESFSSTMNKLTTLNLQNTAIKTLNVAGSSDLNSITLAANSGVKELNLNNTGLTNASLAQILSNAPLLENISLNFLNVTNKISSIDFSSNPELKSITVMNNAVTGTLDLTGLNKLEEVNLYNNGLTGFVASSPVLTKLTLNNNTLTSVDLTGCTALEELNCSNNTTLTSIDLTTNNALKNIYIQNNALATIDINPSLTPENLNVGGNALNFSTLPRVTVTGTYNYAVQSGVMAISIEADLTSIDMAKYLTAITNGPVPGTLGQKSTVYKVWGYKNGTVTEVPYLPTNPILSAYTVSNNKYTFDRSKLTALSFSDIVYFEVKNAAFPNLTLKTSEVELGKEPVGINPSEEISSVVYYNSASKEIYYEVEGAQTISVINLMGQVVYTQSLASDKADINVNNLAQGVYVVQITTNAGKTITSKMVIK